MGVSEKLMRIQTEIKAPKNLYNSFGKYKYRNAEGICEAVKPFLTSEKVILTLSDEIVEIGGRVYVKATALLCDTDTLETHEVSAYAREPAEKKGMDESQITGTASSYARKYALNGLFLLDDTKDADSDEYSNEAENKLKSKTKAREAKTPEFIPATLEQINKINEFVDAYAEACENATSRDIWDKLKVEYGFKHTSDISSDVAEKIIKRVSNWYHKIKGC